MNRRNWYSQRLNSNNPGVLDYFSSINNHYGGGIFAEITIGKSYQGKNTWQLEYLGGFPSAKIERVTFKNIAKEFACKLKSLINARSYADAEKIRILDMLIGILRYSYNDLNSEAIFGSIVLARRTANKKLIKQDMISTIAGKFRNKLKDADLLKMKSCGIVPIELTPRKIIAEICRYKSARAELFQKLLKLATFTLNKHSKKRHPKVDSFAFTGDLTFMVSMALAVYGTGKLIASKQENFTFIEFCKSYLRFFRITRGDIGKAIANIAQSDLKKRIENQFTKSLQNALSKILKEEQ